MHPGGEFIGEEALIAKLRGLRGRVQCIPPDFSLYQWSGSVWLEGKKFCNVTTEQLVRRPLRPFWRAF